MSSINVEIGEAQIQKAIAVSLAEAFSPEKRDQLLRDVIRAHLTVKQNSYDRETLLSKQVGQAIRDSAVSVLTQKIKEWRPEIEAVVDRVMGPQFRDNIIKSLEVALQRLTWKELHISAEVLTREED